MVEFCPKCGSMMMPKREGGKIILACPRCGYRKQSQSRYVLSKSITHKETERTYIVEGDQNLRTLPKVNDAKCPKCNNNEAYYWVIQTRRADEPATRFYKCTKCGHVWREYE